MLELQVDTSSLHRLVAAIDAEEGGQKLRRDLSKNLREAVTPAAQAARESVMAMHSGAVPEHGESLRAAIAAQVKLDARLTGDGAGVRVRVGRAGPRGFTNAARKVDRSEGWRHPVYGRPGWVHQVGKPFWFEDPLNARRDEYEQAVLQAMQDMAQRIAALAGEAA